jgi:hypothetical protein
MKLSRMKCIAGPMTALLAAAVLQGCATAKPCKGKLEPINAPMPASKTVGGKFP